MTHNANFDQNFNQSINQKEQDDDIFFADECEDDIVLAENENNWKMLVVDDEPEVHHITQFALNDYYFQNRGLIILGAYSGYEARQILRQHQDIAIILLDVVMETDDAGLKLVKYIRDEIKNNLVRIILRTGQPGQAPERKVIIQYDINDYKNKVELTDGKLFTLVTASLRSYADLLIIESYRLDLETKVKQRTKELAESNQRLLELNQALRQLNQDKNEFLHIAAHDLKNPLFAIRSLANLIQVDNEKLSIQRITEFAHTIETSAIQMFNLIKRLLDVNAIESGKMQFSLEVFNIVEILRLAVHGYQEQARQKNIQFDVYLAADKQLIYADKQAFKEIIDNLVSNAIKYSPADRKIALNAYSRKKYVRIEVSDQGPGLTIEDQQKLFKKFSRLTPRPTANESSSGLGLFIVKNLVTAMGGKIWCETQPGEGACFFVVFPQAEAVENAENLPKTLKITSPMSKAEFLQKSFQSIRETESRLVQFLDAMPLGVAVVDASGKLYYVNQKAQLLLGKGIVANTTHENFAQIYQLHYSGSENLYDVAQLPITQALQGVALSVDDMEIHIADNIIPLEVWATPIYDENQQISHAIMVFQDIAKRKKSEAERERFTSELVQMKKSYERFVPREFLNLLNKQNVIDVQLGDQIEKEMTVMFSDIRGFTTLSEDMEPQEIFDFINNYLGQMEPIILKHRGFIDKYIGDAIMALFPADVDEAVRGSISMLQTLNQYNQLLKRAGYPSIKIGIGLNTGPLVLGTVGGQNRMDGTVISDTVNTAARIEALTKIYDTPLLITAQSYVKLKNIMEYHIRVIDSVKVKGKSNVVIVYEVFDADAPNIIELKLRTLRDFEQGFMCYHNGKIEQARYHFEQVNTIYPNDKPTLVYLERCQVV